MKNQKGFSLTEILVTLGILGTMGAIATISYNGYMESATKTSLKDAGTMFANSVKTCIKASGGWEIKKLKADGTLPDDCTTATDCLLPCKATNTAELKKTLDFTCPTKATCATYINKGKDHYCLSIHKEKKQVLVRVHYKDPVKYEIWCGEVSSYLPLGGKSCREGDIPQGQGVNRVLVSLNDKGFKQGENCWKVGTPTPKPTSTPTPTPTPKPTSTPKPGPRSPIQ